MMMAKDKPSEADAILKGASAAAKGTGTETAPTEPEQDDAGMLENSMADLSVALKDNKPREAAMAFRAAMEICMMESATPEPAPPGGMPI